MKQVIVRYKVKPEQAAENEELVRAVYAELHETKPASLHYATFRLDDGVSFVHLSAHATEGPSRSRTWRPSSASRRTLTTAATKPRS